MTELIKTPGKTEYTTILGDKDGVANANVRLSGLYNINAYKWATEKKPLGEAWCNLNFNDFVVGSEPTTLTNGLVEVVKGDMKFQSWVLNDGVLEYLIGFAAIPTKFDLEFTITDSGNLSYSFQDNLSQADIDRGFDRPDNVNGSYAVYFSKKNNDYKTGKFCHLFRWRVQDADGKKEWCKPLRIESGKLIIGLPVNWMQSAKYPVFAMGADDTFGYTTPGSSNFGNSGTAISGSMETTTGGEITAFHCAVAVIHGTFNETKLSLYDANQITGDIGGEDKISDATFDLAVSDDESTAASGTLVATTRYGFTYLMENTDTKIKYDWASDVKGYYKTLLNYGDQWTNPAPISWVQEGSNKTLPSLWVDYIPAGEPPAGRSIPLINSGLVNSPFIGELVS